MQLGSSIIHEFYSKPNGSLYSNIRHKRYLLWRTWDMDSPYVMFVGYHPIHGEEDPGNYLISRLLQISKSWNYGGFILANLFGHIKEKPLKYKPCGTYEMEDAYLETFRQLAESTVLIWDKDGHKYQDRILQIKELFPEAHCFDQTKTGIPISPITLSDKKLITKPFNWNVL